jgi:hypothetical protein
MLCRWAAHFGTEGLGVDLSHVFLTAARARAAELGVTGRVRFEHGDASHRVGEAVGAAAPYDIVSCIGATWIGGGVGGTIDLMRPAMAPGGLMLVGEPYWTEPPPAEAYAAMGVAPGESTSLVGTMDRFEAAGMRLVEMVLADGDSWDRYVASQWWTVTRWLDVNGDHADAPEMRRFLEDTRRSHLAYGRRYFGWGVFVLRPA